MRRTGAFVRDRTGATAVEFALVVPVLLLVYIGCAEVSASVTIARRAQAVAGEVNDLVARSTSLTASDVRSIFAVGTSALAPFDAAPMSVSTTSIAVDDTGRASVDWACGDVGGGQPAKGAAIALPSRLAGLRKTHILKTETRYDYTPFSHYVYVGSVRLGGVNYASPRYSDKVDSPGCT